MTKLLDFPQKHNLDKIIRRSICIELNKHKGNPPIEAIRMALSGLFHSMASGIEKDYPEEEFMPFFPIRLTLSYGDANKWDFHIEAKLENCESVYLTEANLESIEHPAS